VHAEEEQVQQTSNPAFRNLPQGGGYAGFNAAGATQAAEAGNYPGQVGAAQGTERPMTIDDVVTKTAITLGTLVVAGGITAYFQLFALAIPAAIIGLVISLVIIFKRNPSPPLVLTYAVAEGIFLGAISAFFELRVQEGIVLQAMIGTVGVFVAMLVVYRTGAIRVTPRLTKWVIGALVGVVVMMLGSFILGMFGVNTGLRDGSPLSIIFSLVIIGIAAFSLLLDFDQADQMIRQGVPAKWAWYVAFGLTVTLVWLYLEILRLLSYLNSD
jgi:uncharacterized YccA/Bax inhibitor family protein